MPRMGKTWNLKDAGVMVDTMKKEIAGAVDRALLAAAHRTVEHIVTSVMPAEPRVPVDRGLYRSGWRAFRFEHGAIVENKTPPAPYIEFGVRAENVKISRAMIEELAKWVKRKGLGGQTVISKSGKSRAVKATDTEATSIAWAIAKSMQKNGIFNRGKGLRILEKAEKKIPDFIREEVGRELKKL